MASACCRPPTAHFSQVDTILNHAVTIATEASTGGLSTSQSAALNTEFQSILSEINQIGLTTNFNGTSVFTGNSTTYQSTQGTTSDPLTTASALTDGANVTITDSATGGTFVFTAGATSTIASLQTAITNAETAGTLSSGVTATFVGGKLQYAGATGDSLQVSTNDAVLGGFTVPAGDAGTDSVFTSDGTSTGSATLITNIGALSANSLGLTSSMNLNTTAAAQTALTAITAAISTVAQDRGNIGASVNALTSDSNVETTEVQNLTSAQNNIQNADIATVTSQMSQYNVLEQTGFAALAQTNSAEQNVLKLLQ